MLYIERVREEVNSWPESGMVKYRSVFASGRGTEWDVEKTWNHQQGMELVGLEKYVKGRIKS